MMPMKTRQNRIILVEKNFHFVSYDLQSNVEGIWWPLLISWKHFLIFFLKSILRSKIHLYFIVLAKSRRRSDSRSSGCSWEKSQVTISLWWFKVKAKQCKYSRTNLPQSSRSRSQRACRPVRDGTWTRPTEETLPGFHHVASITSKITQSR